MPNTPDVTKPYLDAGPVLDDALLPASPFHALRYQFGMLLGVDDFETAQAYPRGKMRLHNAWLHGAGAVWGLGVSAPKSDTDATLRGEIQVEPGLALDAAGHELHLDAAACVNVAAWYAKHKGDAGFTVVTDPSGRISWDAHVELRFRACLTRQVPAMSEPCDGATGTATAYSRAFETVEITLVPGKSAPAAPPYHRLRVLFGIGELATPPTVAEQDVLAALADIASKPAAQQAPAFLAAFRRFAALDEIERRPGTSKDGTRVLLFGGAEDEPVTIADVHVALDPGPNGTFTLVTATVDPTVRPTHVATSTIQELNLWSAPGTGATGDAGGPRVDRATVALTANTLTFRATSPLDAASVHSSAFSVSQFDATDGWTTLEIQGAAVDATNTLVTITLKAAPRASTIRLIASGTGAEPILGAGGVPLAGATGGRPGSPFDGNDFVHMWKRS